MPSTITHAYIGLDTFNKLNEKPKRIIKEHIDNYKVYCQGMDILYFYRILLLKENTVNKLGHRFHKENTFKAFNLLILDNKENKDPELFTFISGLITHYIADSTIHPYINYLSANENRTYTLNKHFEIETYIDNYYIKNKMKINHKNYNNSKFIFNYQKKEIIKEELTKLFKTVYNYPNMGKRYYQALQDMHFVFNFIRYDKTGIKKKIYQLIDLNPFKNIRRVKYLSYNFNLDNDEYYLNLSRKKWHNIANTSIQSSKSFLDLYDDVVNKSSNIINELYEYIFNNKKVDLKELIQDLSYANGLSLSPNKD